MPIGVIHLLQGGRILVDWKFLRTTGYDGAINDSSLPTG